MLLRRGAPRGSAHGVVYWLARSQRPGHSPATERTPAFADEWLDAYDAGRDVVRWYDKPAA